jgi:hypothetical protein
MSTSTLNVWITAIGDPCHISNTEYFVSVVDCEGNPLDWCGKTYKSLPTECGHIELEVPPGCYAVFAVQQPGGIQPFGNLLTNVAIVRVNCGDHACVTLFAPDAHLCGSWFGGALRDIANTPDIPRELVTAALEAVNRLVAVLEPTTFSRNLDAFKPGSDDR